MNMIIYALIVFAYIRVNEILNSHIIKAKINISIMNIIKHTLSTTHKFHILPKYNIISR